jgi:methionyl-tRNA synthetase
MEHISYDDFKKLDMRIGHIKFVEPVPETDKLLRFEIDFGEEEPRQVVSGIREFYPDYEQLVGKFALYVVNLEPRTIKGVESHGMLMAVDGLDGQPVFLVPEDGVEPGSKVR